MNHYQVINNEYISSSRTIEMIRVCNENREAVLWLYNHDGLYFKLFYSIMNLCTYLFEGKATSFIEFEGKELLDRYLEKVEIATLIRNDGKG